MAQQREGSYMRRRCAAGIVGVRWGSERNGGLEGGGGQTVVGAYQQLHPLSLSFSTIYNAGAQTLGGKKTSIKDDPSHSSAKGFCTARISRIQEKRLE